MTQAPSSSQPPRRLRDAVRNLPRGTLLRLAFLALLLSSGFFLLRWPPIAEQLTQENITALLTQLRAHWWSPILLVASLAITAAIGLPVSPLVVGGGAVFGAVAGSALNTGGLFLGGLIGYGIASRLGRDAIRQLTGPKLRRAERVFERRGFWPLVQIRFMPFPFALINYGAALAGVKAGRFLLTTALGIAPSTVMHTVFASKLAAADESSRLAIVTWWGAVWATLAIVTGLPTVRNALRRRRRYRDLVAARQQRATGPR